MRYNRRQSEDVRGACPKDIPSVSANAGKLTKCGAVSYRIKNDGGKGYESAEYFNKSKHE